MAYIRKYRTGWRAEVQRHGQRVTHVAATKREAQAWALAKEAELAATARAGGRTLGAAVDHYLRTVSAHKRSPEWEARRLAAALAHFGADTPIASITSDTIGRWRDARLASVSGSTVQREANLLRHLFTLAAGEWGWIDRNPWAAVRLPAHNPPRRAMWTWPLIRRVLRAPRSGKTAEVQQAFRVALHTGLRLSEVLTAQWDARRRVLTLPRSKTTRPGERVEVPVTPRAARLLSSRPMAWTVGANEASTLFSRLLRELLIEGLTFHDARAAALTWLSRRMDVMTLARISRHRDLRILMDTYYRETAEQISQRLGRA